MVAGRSLSHGGLRATQEVSALADLLQQLAVTALGRSRALLEFEDLVGGIAFALRLLLEEAVQVIQAEFGGVKTLQTSYP